MPQLDFSKYLGQIFWLAVSFTILYAFIKLWFYPRLNKLLAERASKTLGLIDEAKALKDKAQGLHEQYLLQLDDMHNQLSTINEETQQFCQQYYASKLVVFDKDCVKQKKRSTQKLQIWQNALELEVKQIALDLAASLLSTLLSSFGNKSNKKVDLEKYYDKTKN